MEALWVVLQADISWVGDLTPARGCVCVRGCVIVCVEFACSCLHLGFLQVLHFPSTVQKYVVRWTGVAKLPKMSDFVSGVWAGAP